MNYDETSLAHTLGSLTPRAMMSMRCIILDLDIGFLKFIDVARGTIHRDAATLRDRARPFAESDAVFIRSAASGMGGKLRVFSPTISDADCTALFMISYALTAARPDVDAATFQRMHYLGILFSRKVGFVRNITAEDAGQFAQIAAAYIEREGHPEMPLQ